MTKSYPCAQRGVGVILNVAQEIPIVALWSALGTAAKHKEIYTHRYSPPDARLFDDKAEQRIASLLKQSSDG